MRYQPGDLIFAPGVLYRVDRVLGAGGMGEVYACREKGLNARCVVKMLNAEAMRRASTVTRFEREARALAQLDHPNIVRVIHLGRDKFGTPFYTMEFLPGDSLRRMMKRSKIVPPQVALPIAVQILWGLAHAHERGLVHRDMKPENVIHYQRNGNDEVKLIDFGVMRVMAENGEEVFAGTYAYASPEQIEGGDVGPTADLFAVGVILFEMLTGKRPFERFGHDELGALRRVRQSAPLLSEFGSFPKPLVEVVGSALSSDPAKRPADALEFSTTLRKIHDALELVDPRLVITQETLEPSNALAPITAADLGDPTDPDGNTWAHEMRAMQDAREFLGHAPTDIAPVFRLPPQIRTIEDPHPSHALPEALLSAHPSAERRLEIATVQPRSDLPTPAPSGPGGLPYVNPAREEPRFISSIETRTPRPAVPPNLDAEERLPAPRPNVGPMFPAEAAAPARVRSTPPPKDATSVALKAKAKRRRHPDDRLLTPFNGFVFGITVVIVLAIFARLGVIQFGTSRAETPASTTRSP